MFGGRFSSKEKIGLSCALIFMSFALLDRLIVSPINNKIKKINQEIRLNHAQLAFDLSNVSQKDVIAEEYGKYIKNQKDFGSDEEKITVMLSVLEDLGRDSGLTLLDIKPQQSEQTDLFKTYSIAVEAEGTTAEVVKFLHKMDTSEHLMRVEKLRLSTKDRDEQHIKASILITKVFVL